jgi:hypothetical protein
MENALELAKAFRQKKHFSKEAWLKRGLNPSRPDVCSKLTLLMIRSTDQFIAAIESGASPDELRTVLEKGLDSFSESYFDTEENEYICELFYELGQMVGLNMSDEANSFMYGPGLAELLANQEEKKPVEVLENNCTKCGAILKTLILEKDKDSPPGCIIGRCQSCDELNLLEYEKDIKEIGFENYIAERFLEADNYTKEEVLKIFGKMKKSKKR